MPTDAGPKSLPLRYAQVRESHVGLFFWPSLRSVVLVLLAALATAWLARRHAPWRFAADIPADRHSIVSGASPFVPSVDGLLSFDFRGGVNLVDLSTGRLRKNILPSLNYYSPTVRAQLHFRILNNGDRLAVLTEASPTFRIYDTRTGAIDAELPNPIAGHYGSVLLSPDGTKVVTELPGTPPIEIRFDGQRFETLRLSGACELKWPAPPERSTPDSVDAGSCIVWKYDAKNIPEIVKVAHNPYFSPSDFLNGGKLLVGTHGYDKAMLDAENLRVVSWLDGLVISPPDPDAHYVLSIAMSANPKLHHTLLSTDDGQELDSADGQVVWSPDLSVRAVLRPPGTPFSMSLFDRKSGKLLPSIVEPTSHPQFFPTGGRFVTRTGAYQQEAIYDTRHPQPLALLEEAGAAAQDGGVEVAGNGRSILIHRTVPGFSGYRLFRQTGWDCPESTFGVLAFPQTWLTIVLLVAAAVSLLSDARSHANHAPYRAPVEIVLPLFGICVLLAVHFAVEACMGHWIRTPAPLLAIACIGMMRGSQAWRWIAVLLLCGAAAWCASRFLVLRSVREDFYPLLDRVYGFPHAVRLALVIVTTLALASTAVLLARPSRSS